MWIRMVAHTCISSPLLCGSLMTGSKFHKEHTMIPTKQQVREWQQQRIKAATPPPTPEQIRLEHGLGMIHGKAPAAR